MDAESGRNRGTEKMNHERDKKWKREKVKRDMGSERRGRGRNDGWKDSF